MSRFFSVALGMCLLTGTTMAGWSLPINYSTGFESAEGFSAGSYSAESTIDSGGVWTVETGTAEVITSVVREGQQSLMVTAGGSVDADAQAITGDSNSVMWLQGYYQAMPQSEDPDLAEITQPSSALMYFNDTEGIMVYDGSQSDWVSVQSSVVADQWYLITIRLDFNSQTWDIFVDNQLKMTGIGFKDQVTEFNGFRCRAGESSGYLDSFYVGATPPENIVQEPAYDGMDFFLYSVYWIDEQTNETPFNESNQVMLNLIDDDMIDWLDIFEYMKNRLAQ